MSGDGRPPLEIPDAAGVRLAVAATRWHAEVVDVLVDRALAAAGKAGVDDRPWCGCPVRSSCRWWRRRWPAGTTRWWRSAW